MWPEGRTETGCGSAKGRRVERTAVEKKRAARCSDRFAKTRAGQYIDDHRAARRAGIRRGAESYCRFSSRGIGRTFFFQAEDGIRDLTVTGVQTCALPI